MREMVLGQDASFTRESFIKRYNSDLANDYGNLLSRVTKLIQSNFEGIVPDPGDDSDSEKGIIDAAVKTIKDVQTSINAMRVNEAIEETLQFIREINRYMEEQAPWKLVKSDKESGGRVLYTAAEALRIGTLLLNPVMPHRTNIVLETIKCQNSHLKWGGLSPGTELRKHTPLFPRINIKKEKPSQIQVKENLVTYEDFEKLGLKTAEVLSAEKVDNSDKLFKLQIKLGEEERQIVSGIADHYSEEELVGKMIVVASNLKPTSIRDEKSEGMLLAASKKKDLTIVVVDKDKVESGKKVY